MHEVIISTIFNDPASSRFRKHRKFLYRSLAALNLHEKLAIEIYKAVRSEFSEPSTEYDALTVLTARGSLEKILTIFNSLQKNETNPAEITDFEILKILTAASHELFQPDLYYMIINFATNTVKNIHRPSYGYLCSRLDTIIYQFYLHGHYDSFLSLLEKSELLFSNREMYAQNLANSIQQSVHARFYARVFTIYPADSSDTSYLRLRSLFYRREYSAIIKNFPAHAGEEYLISLLESDNYEKFHELTENSETFGWASYVHAIYRRDTKGLLDCLSAMHTPAIYSRFITTKNFWTVPPADTNSFFIIERLRISHGDIPLFIKNNTNLEKRIQSYALISHAENTFNSGYYSEYISFYKDFFSHDLKPFEQETLLFYLGMCLIKTGEVEIGKQNLRNIITRNPGTPHRFIIRKELSAKL